MKTMAIAMLLSLLSLTGASHDDSNRSLCCLCECHAWDERDCANLCLVLQHGKEVVNESTMKLCTRQCAEKKMRRAK